MNSTEKDNIVQKAICCSGTLGKQVADMYLSGNRCADKEFQKLFLLTSYIDALGCYQAPLEVTTYTVVAGDSVLSEWDITMNCATAAAVPTGGETLTLTVNGTPTTVNGDNVSTVVELLEGVLTGLGFTYIAGACIGDTVTYEVIALCNTETMTCAVTILLPNSNVTCTITTEGNCAGSTIETTVTTTEYTNCLTEDQADDIATQISKICDLCDEH